MGELICFLAALSLAGHPLLSGQLMVMLPVSPNGFMPFQDNYVLWKTIGFGGLGVFQMRWLIQWLYSEAKKESRMPLAFWWLSMVGSLMELAYFLRQQDSVGILGCLGGFTYARNLVLIYRKRRIDRERAAAELSPT